MKRQADEHINADGSGWNLAQVGGFANLYTVNLKSMQDLIELRENGQLGEFAEVMQRLERVVRNLQRLDATLGDKTEFAVAFFNAAMAIIKTPNADLAIPNTTPDSLKDAAIGKTGLFIPRQ